jgi:3-hydroxyacyl-[acyl-carrier-protein] dehydratase
MARDPLSTALAHLPHGPEFRFIDRLTALDPGKSGTGEYTVRGDEPFLRGHFPGDPLLPGVLLIEAAAQLAGTVAQSDPQIAPLKALRLTAVRGAKILGTAKPGQTITLEAHITGRMPNLVQASIIGSLAGHIILRTELTLSGSSSLVSPSD